MPDRHAQLRVALVEADDGRVRALRAVRLTPAFTTALHAAIRAQASRPAPAVAAVSRVARLYQEPPPHRIWKSRGREGARRDPMRER